MENQENLNEGRTQIKRKYAEHSHIHVNEKAPIRNKVIEFVGKRFVTEDEMKAFLTQLTEERGKEFDQRQWFNNNKHYFESFENRGQKVWTLSKFGKRVLENVIKGSQQKQMVKESIGLFKSEIFESMNEAIDVNYWLGYNKDTSGQMPKENMIMGKDFEDEFENAVVEWQHEADEKLTATQIKRVRVVAEEFFKKEKQISVAIIHAMIAQEA